MKSWYKAGGILLLLACLMVSAARATGHLCARSIRERSVDLVRPRQSRDESRTDLSRG